MIKDIAGRPVQVGDVVAYAAESHGDTWTRLYIVHSIKITVEDRNHEKYDAATGKSTWEMRPTELPEICLRGFKLSWWDQQHGRPVNTYVRLIRHVSGLIKIDNLSHLDPNEPIHQAVLQWVKKQQIRNSWPFPTDNDCQPN
jgi:hypothetical protein